MAIKITRNRSYGRVANSIIFFLMVIWCIFLGVGAFLFIKLYVAKQIAESGGESHLFVDVFPIVWAILMGIATLVFLIIALTKISGVRKKREIIEYGHDSAGRISGGSSTVGIYSNTPIVTHKVSFVYKMDEIDYGQTTQLVSRRVYNAISRHYKDGVVPILAFEYDAVLNEEAILKGEKAKVPAFSTAQQNKPQTNNVTPQQAPQSSGSGVKVISRNKTLKTVLSPEDEKYIDDLSYAYFQDDDAKIKELGTDRFEALFKEYDTPAINYIRGKQHLNAAVSSFDIEWGLQYIAIDVNRSLDPRALLDMGMLYENGKKPYINPDKNIAIELYCYTIIQTRSFSVGRQLLKICDKEPDLFTKDKSAIGIIYVAIGIFATGKQNANAYHFLYKNANLFFDKPERFERFPQTKLPKIKDTFLSLAEKYGYQNPNSHEPITDVYSEEEMKNFFIRYLYMFQMNFKGLDKKSRDKVSDQLFNEIYCTYLARRIAKM